LLAAGCTDAVEQCVQEFGGLDVLINVAGKHQMRRTESMTDDDWAQDLAVNLNGPFYLCRAALPNCWNEAATSSTSAPLPASKASLFARYGAAKHGLIGSLVLLAVEYTAIACASTGMSGRHAHPANSNSSVRGQPELRLDHAHGLAPRRCSLSMSRM